MRRLLCWLVGHKPERGCSRERALYFHCVRCGAHARGEWAVRR